MAKLVFIIILAWFTIVLVMGCTEEEKDPLTVACETACALEETHPCISHRTKCIADCLAYANQVQKEYNRTSCAECVASTASYSLKDNCEDADCCWGPLPLQRPEEIAQCHDKCWEPDAGVPY